VVSSIQEDIKMDLHIAVHCSYYTTSIPLLTRYFILIANSFVPVYITVFSALLHCATFAAMVYTLILVNNTDCSFCSDEMKKMKRDLERRILGQCFAQCVVFVNFSYIIYLLVFGKGDQVKVLFYGAACCGIMCVLVQMKMCYDINGQIISLQDELHY